jgi:hypothetical protein
MRQLLIGVTAAIAVVGPVSAQAPPPGPGQSLAAQPYPIPGGNFEDAYRIGLINRWELERYQGPTPQALQGPSANGDRGRGTGGGGGGGM